jgi:hypothetical protein
MDSSELHQPDSYMWLSNIKYQTAFSCASSFALKSKPVLDSLSRNTVSLKKIL